VRGVFTALASALVVALSIGYLVTPSATGYALSVKEDNSLHVARGSEVLYGKATTMQGRPEVGLRIAVSGKVGHRAYCVTLVSGRDGTYRRQVQLPAGVYTVTVVEPWSWHHRPHSVSERIRLRPGHAYRIDVHQTRRGLFTFLPVSSY